MAKAKKKIANELIIPKVTISKQFDGEKKPQKRVMGPFKLVKERDNRFYNNEEKVWNLKVKKNKKGKRSSYSEIGSITVDARNIDNRAVMCVTYVDMSDNSYAGLGLMSKSYQFLANHYGALESDPNGDTSDEAQRIWKTLKGKKLPNGRYRIEKKTK